MKEGRPSQTAMIVAFRRLMASRDPVLRPLLVDADEPFSGWVLEGHSAEVKDQVERLRSAAGHPFLRLLTHTAQRPGPLFILVRKLFVEDEVRAALSSGRRAGGGLRRGLRHLGLRLAPAFPAVRFFELRLSGHPGREARGARVPQRGAPGLVLVDVDFSRESAEDKLRGAPGFRGGARARSSWPRRCCSTWSPPTWTRSSPSSAHRGRRLAVLFTALYERRDGRGRGAGRAGGLGPRPDRRAREVDAGPRRDRELPRAARASSAARWPTTRSCAPATWLRPAWPSARSTSPPSWSRRSTPEAWTRDSRARPPRRSPCSGPAAVGDPFLRRLLSHPDEPYSAWFAEEHRPRLPQLDDAVGRHRSGPAGWRRLDPGGTHVAPGAQALRGGRGAGGPGRRRRAGVVLGAGYDPLCLLLARVPGRALLRAGPSRHPGGEAARAGDAPGAAGRAGPGGRGPGGRRRWPAPSARPRASARGPRRFRGRGGPHVPRAARGGRLAGRPGRTGGWRQPLRPHPGGPPDRERPAPGHPFRALTRGPSRGARPLDARPPLAATLPGPARPAQPPALRRRRPVAPLPGAAGGGVRAARGGAARVRGHRVERGMPGTMPCSFRSRSRAAMRTGRRTSCSSGR